MYPANISTDNLNILFPKNKKYNPYVGWVDAVVYFRHNRRLHKRRFMVISKTAAVSDYQNFLSMQKNYNMDDEQKNEQTMWLLCKKKNLEEFKKNKKVFIRHIYDVPEIGDQVHQDLLYMDQLSDDGQKPYASEIILPEETININSLRSAARYYLKTCFGINLKIKDINFLIRMNKTEIKKEWREYKKQRDRMNELRKKGIKPNIVFKENAAKYLFGENVKEFKIEGSKRTIVFDDGSCRTEVQRNFKIVDLNNDAIKKKKD